jgi:hypothetical protein
MIRIKLKRTISMLPYQQLEFQILQFIKNHSVRPWVCTTLPELTSALNIVAWDVVDTLKRLHRDGCLQLRKFIDPDGYQDFTDRESGNDFFYSAGFEMSFAPNGRPYFEKLQAAAGVQTPPSVTPQSPAEGVKAVEGLPITKCAEDKTRDLGNFVQANLRRAIFTPPSKEIEIQNAIETLIVGRGMKKGIDYDRETGRVKTSGKESIPDFIFPNLSLCLEVKLSKSADKLKALVDEINADIRAYSKRYDRQLYTVYDLGIIRDEEEFKRDLEDAPGVSVLVIKH